MEHAPCAGQGLDFMCQLMTGMSLLSLLQGPAQISTPALGSCAIQRELCYSEVSRRGFQLSCAHILIFFIAFLPLVFAGGESSTSTMPTIPEVWFKCNVVADALRRALQGMPHNGWCGNLPELLRCCSFLSVQSQAASQQPAEQLEVLRLHMSRVVFSSSSYQTGDSQTTLGEAVLRTAERTVMFVVRDRHKQLAELWLANAPAKARNAWRAAVAKNQRRSRNEAALQSAMAAMFAALPQDWRIIFHDTHKIKSVCGSWKPDFVACSPGALLPVNTAFLLELRSQGSAYYTPAHIQQVGLCQR